MGQLTPTVLKAHARLVECRQAQANSAQESDPATKVMTDFRVRRAFSVEPTRPIHEANDKMIACAVRLLFVLDSQSTITGLITSKDILGEKPLKYISEHGGSRNEILVQDIMTPASRLEAVNLDDVTRSTVADVVTMMKARGRQHMLVVSDDGTTLHGIFSTTQIGHQLGKEIEMPMRATTFAELGEAIAS